MTHAASDGPITVAMLDDDQMYREFVGLLLARQPNFVFLPAGSTEELVAILDGQAVDCVLLDYNLGRDTGLAVHAMMEARYPDAPPTVMLTGDGRERTVIKAMRLGIRDYLPKRDLTADEIVSVIGRTVKRHRAELQQKAEHRRLVQLSGVDTVTGLLAREPLDTRLTQLDALLPRSRVGYGLFLIEMAELDHINERFGLGLGDRALRAFAQRLRLPTRQSDMCGRYAGSTFLYIVDSGADPDLLASVGEQLRQQTDFRVNFDQASLHLTSHIGGALFFADGRTTEGVLSEARRRLREARESGVRMILATNGAARPQAAEVEASTGEPVEALPRPILAGTEDPTMRTADFRRSPRQRVFKRGRILTPDSNSTIDCTLRNVSQTGAALRFDVFFALPEEFDLVLVGAGQKRRCRVRWQSGVDVGVQYLT
jgi:diguanylate cyclase (GGDEF)-like protein